MVGPGVSPLGSMLRAQARVGRQLLGAAWRRELGTLCSAGPETDWQTQTGTQGLVAAMLCHCNKREECLMNAHTDTVRQYARVGRKCKQQLRWAPSSGPENLIWT